MKARWALLITLLIAVLAVGISSLTLLVDDAEVLREDSSAVVPTTSTTAASSTTTPRPAITEAATTTQQAVRDTVQIQVTEPPPPPWDPVAYVNSLSYSWGDPAPAMEAYRIVTATRGWPQETIDKRATFVQRIMHGESNFCWNARRASYATYHLMPCSELRQGVHDDVGFGQITNVLRPLTCEKANICSIADTLASPWNSMVAYVVVLEELGKRPWCYLRNLHIRNGDCATWPG